MTDLVQISREAVLDRITKAVLAGRDQDLRSLLREAPGLARMRFEQDVLVKSIPHQVYKGDTPLHLAAAAVRLQATKTLLKAGADVDAANRRGARPLHYACDPRPSDADNWRPREQVELIALLVARGAQVDASDKAGIRPLHRAVRARSPGAVRVLLEAGCDPRARAGKAGSTPLHLAVSETGASGTSQRSELQAEIVALLIDAGGALSDVDDNGKSVLDRIRSAVLWQALSNLGLIG